MYLKLIVNFKYRIIKNQNLSADILVFIVYIDWYLIEDLKLLKIRECISNNYN